MKTAELVEKLKAERATHAENLEKAKAKFNEMVKAIEMLKGAAMELTVRIAQLDDTIKMAEGNPSEVNPPVEA